MKSRLLILTMMCMLGCAMHPAKAQTTIHVFNEVVFYDGYASVVNDTLPAGITRFRNDLITRKLTSQELQSIGSSLSMRVVVKALCDNYDRIGNVNLALVPKGAATYNTDSVSKIELGRYITPFMNKNVQPDTVPYNYVINNVAGLLKENSIVSNYDIWIELELFGVPYAANTQVSGCSGRNDVFKGSLDFITDGSTQSQSGNFLLPVAFKKDFNNYTATATDTLGKTTRTFDIDLPTKLSDVDLFLITSNHGANSGGEEYNRRWHYVYFDGSLVLQYKPGSTSCEPFRVYNTQSNGIYGTSPKTDAQWQSFSNWCPGDAIPIRNIHFDSLSSGSHTFRITVPDAVFNGGQGNFPLSLYLQGKTTSLGIGNVIRENDIFSYPNPVRDILHIHAGEQILSVSFFDLLGKKVLETDKCDVDLSDLVPGVYSAYVYTHAHNYTVIRVLKN